LRFSTARVASCTCRGLTARSAAHRESDLLPEGQFERFAVGIGDQRNITDRFAEIGRGPGRPTDPLPVVRYHTKAGERSLDSMRWGIVNLADSARLFPAPLG